MVDVIYKREPNTSVVKPQYHTRGAAAFDIGPMDNLVLQPGEILRANTGLVIKTPPEHYLMLTHRSSTPARWGVQILLGIVDEDYAGDDDELAITVWNFKQEVVRIPAGTRIAQGLFIPVTHARFDRVDSMPDPSRGGYGSTG